MVATTPQELHWQIVQAATLAPSVHNTQPWRFSSYEDGLDLWADPDRQLAVLDPDGRQLHLSCGAALLHARVAARAHAVDAEPHLLPDPGDPTHLARLRLTAGPDPTADELALAGAILRRHTHREPFDERPVPYALLDRLRSTAEREGAHLSLVTDPDALLELEVLLSNADRVEEADPAYRHELASWMRRAPAGDGIPPEALPADPERGSSLRLRDFGDADSGPTGDEPPAPEHPAVAVLASADDTPVSWLQAGQALGAVLLLAAQEGVLAQPLGQVTDLAAFRWRLGRAIGLLATPQLALRMGYASSPPATPRRDVADVLTDPEQDHSTS